MNSSVTIYVDGASSGNPGPAGIGVVVYDASGNKVKTLSKYIVHATNNFTEYTALLYGIQEVLLLGARDVVVNTDSELMKKQISGEYRIKDAKLTFLSQLILHMTEAMNSFTIRHISRNENKEADTLAQIAVRGQAG